MDGLPTLVEREPLLAGDHGWPLGCAELRRRGPKLVCSFAPLRWRAHDCQPRRGEWHFCHAARIWLTKLDACGQHCEVWSAKSAARSRTVPHFSRTFGGQGFGLSHVASRLVAVAIPVRPLRPQRPSWRQADNARFAMPCRLDHRWWPARPTNHGHLGPWTKE
jgi:hypothetical protein